MNNRLLCFSLAGLALTAFAPLPSRAETPIVATTINSTAPSSTKSAVVVNTNITEAEVLAAQKAWGDALVAISTTYDQKGTAAAKALAGDVIDAAYGYQMGTVLFKPTLTTAPQTFRTTRAGALAYFVGGDAAFPNDQGFALKGWRKVEVQNASIFINGDTATTMGNVMITDKAGKVTTVDKTWQFLKDSNGKLRIVLHHSSLPYSPSK
ncbi:MAG: hypothetical protein RLZZ511_4047 [Cyanobacteriota bacterium]|jgi:hypothetical protein